MKKLLKFSLLVTLLIMGDALNAANMSNLKNSNLEIASATEKGKIQDAKNITFNFPNTDIKNFARFIAKLSAKSLIGESLLKGNIDIQSHKKMSLKQVKRVFKTLLNSKALDYVETNIYIEIIPMSSSVVKVYNLKYLKATEVAKSLTEIYRMSFTAGNQPQNIQITPINDANAIMVLAPKNQQYEIAKSIRKLDVRTRQVLLEIMVVELTKNDSFGFGVNFNYDNGGSNSGGMYNGGTPMSFTTSNVPSAGGYSFKRNGWSVDVEAVEKDTELKVLSQPRVIALENQKAEIKIGEKQAYISGNTSLGGDTTGNTQSTETNDIGLDIELTPRINELKNVILELKFKLTNVLGNYTFTSGGNATDGATTSNVPIIGHRIVNNTSTVRDGDTLVIGGLLKNQKTTTITAPPVLGEIPWIGWAFAKESELTEQIELMIFITPHVIENNRDAKTVTTEQTNKLRDFDSEAKNTVDQMLTGKKTPTDDTFSTYDYFTDQTYRKEQHFIKQP